MPSATETQSPITTVILYAWTFPGEAADALDRQLTAGRTWTQTQGGTVLAAYTDITRRSDPCPELERAIQSAETQGAALVCARPERLNRTLALLIARVEDCQRRGVPVFFATDPKPQAAAQTVAALIPLWKEWRGMAFGPEPLKRERRTAPRRGASAARVRCVRRKATPRPPQPPAD